MHKILIAGGDSLCYGTGLSDLDEKVFSPSKLTWPALLAQDLGRRYHCVAIPGYSNTAIARTVMLACQQNLDQDILVTVCWTFLNRYELRFAYDPWSTPLGLKVYENWHNFNRVDLGQEKSHLSENKKTVLKFINEFYRHVGHDDVYEYYTTLKEIVFLQNYLKVNKIPYVFTLAHNFFRKNIKEENIDCLLQQIDMDPWFIFPPFNGFVEWGRDYPRVDEHPADLAHKDAKNLIGEFVNEKITRIRNIVNQ